MSAELMSVTERARVHAALGDPARLAIVDMLTLGDASPGEVATALSLPTNLVAHHVRALQDAGLVVRARSEADRRRTYLQLVPDLLARIGPSAAPVPSRLLFVCTYNSARSQFAAALWQRRSRVPAASAGTQPAPRIHPRAVRIGRRHGLALGRNRPAQVADVLRRGDLVIAVCDAAHEQLGPPEPRRLHWSVPDPARADTDEAFEAAYAVLASRIERLAPTFD